MPCGALGSFVGDPPRLQEYDYLTWSVPSRPVGTKNDCINCQLPRVSATSVVPDGLSKGSPWYIGNETLPGAIRRRLSYTLDGANAEIEASGNLPSIVAGHEATAKGCATFSVLPREKPCGLALPSSCSLDLPRDEPSNSQWRRYPLPVSSSTPNAPGGSLRPLHHINKP